MAELSWKAKRKKGEVYCSPACGRGCTYAEYTHALKQATRLANRLGLGWKPIVHENLGWHYRVESPCGRITVYAHSSISYWADFNEVMQFHATRASPEEAVNAAIDAGRVFTRSLNKQMEGLSGGYFFKEEGDVKKKKK